LEKVYLAPLETGPSGSQDGEAKENLEESSTRKLRKSPGSAYLNELENLDD